MLIVVINVDVAVFGLASHTSLVIVVDLVVVWKLTTVINVVSVLHLTPVVVINTHWKPTSKVVMTIAVFVVVMNVLVLVVKDDVSIVIVGKSVIGAVPIEVVRVVVVCV